jgi:hypothetical protein
MKDTTGTLNFVWPWLERVKATLESFGGLSKAYQELPEKVFTQNGQAEGRKVNSSKAQHFL